MGPSNCLLVKSLYADERVVRMYSFCRSDQESSHSFVAVGETRESSQASMRKLPGTVSSNFPQKYPAADFKFVSYGIIISIIDDAFMLLNMSVTLN